MKQKIFVTATNTDVGKSYACEQLLLKYANEGLSVGYFKPIETGVNGYPKDGMMLLELAMVLNPCFAVSIDDVVPYQFKLPAAPFVAKGDKKIDINIIKEKMEYLHSLCDILIIEGAGGLLVPIEKDYFIIDLIKELADKTILIAPSNLGSINDTLLSQEALKNRDINFDWYINLHKDKETFEEVTLPFYKEYFENIKFI